MFRTQYTLTLRRCLLSLSQKLKAPSEPAVANVWCTCNVQSYTVINFKVEQFQVETEGHCMKENQQGL